MKRLTMRLAAGSGPTFGVDDLACAAATHLRFWADEGLDVTWTPVHGGVAAIQAVMDGTVDGSYGGLGPVLKYRSQGHPVRIIASMARALAQNLVAQASVTTTDHLRGASWAIDGVGALSHHMARLIVHGLKMSDDDITWRVAGPPPERIEMLLAGNVDVSLLRIEEAIALSRDRGNTLHTLLDSSDLKKLVPTQPHGVLSARQDYVDRHQDELSRLAAGIIKASRALRDDFDAFRATYHHYVKIKLPDEEVKAIWEQERANDGFAIDGELTRKHWDKQIALFFELNPDLGKIAYDDVIEPRFVDNVLRSAGS